jgi:hypothetical protein
MQRLPCVIEFSNGDVAFDDLALVDVQSQRATNPAVRADRVGLRHAGIHPTFPRRACRIRSFAISAPVGQTAMQLPQYTHADSGSGTANSGRDVRVESTAGNGDCKRILMIRAARLHAFVTEMHFA